MSIFEHSNIVKNIFVLKLIQGVFFISSDAENRFWGL